MSSDSPVSKVVNSIGGGLSEVGRGFDEFQQGTKAFYTGQYGTALDKFGNMTKRGMKASGLTPPQAPDPQAAPPPPSLGSAASVGVNTELAHEQRMAAASTILTGGGGLTDEPTAASRVLLGS